MTVLRRLLPVLVVVGMGPAAAAGQACGITGGTGVSAAVGLVGYDLANPISGLSWGGDLGLARSRDAGGIGFEGRLGYRRLELEDGPSPHIGRLQVAMALPFAGLSVCPTLHAGASLLDTEGDPFTVTAGGLGLRLAATPVPMGASARVVPYGEVRGLAARSQGSLLGIDVAATGLALGGEVGVQMMTGSLVLRAAGSLDGFDDGLGFTPYPSKAGELSVGVRF